MKTPSTQPVEGSTTMPGIMLRTAKIATIKRMRSFIESQRDSRKLALMGWGLALFLYLFGQNCELVKTRLFLASQGAKRENPRKYPFLVSRDSYLICLRQNSKVIIISYLTTRLARSAWSPMMPDCRSKENQRYLLGEQRNLHQAWMRAFGGCHRRPCGSG